MIWTINNHRTSDLCIPQWTISSLDFLYEEKLALLNQRQRSAVVKFLKFASEDMDSFDASDAKKVYENSWKQFDT